MVSGNARGVLHAANAGATTWADVAERVYRRAGHPDAVTRVSSAEFAAAAPRPVYSVLNCARLDVALQESGGPARRRWEDALDEFLDELAAEVRT